MKINVLTLFPEMFSAITKDSLLGKANEKGILNVNVLDIRDFTNDKHKKVDDTPFGGGCGMLLKCQPIFDCINSLNSDKTNRKIIYMSPRGEVLNKELLLKFLDYEEITIIAGHYEGIDQRAISYYDMEEVSIGDYITTGGELPAMVLVDCLARFIPGVLGNEESIEKESIYSGLLESDQYTKPKKYLDMIVPDELTNGNHKEIKIFELFSALKNTFINRPDLYNKWIKEHDIDSLEGFTKREKNRIKDFINTLK